MKLHKKDNRRVVEEEPGRWFAGAWQSTRDYAARGEPGDPRGRNWGGILGMDSSSRPARAEGGKTAPFGYQEAIGRNTESRVMMKTAPASSFIMTQPEFLLQLFVIPLDDPALLCQTDQVLEFGLGREGCEPVLGGFDFFAGPLDQQPLLGIGLSAFEIAVSGTDAHGGETRLERMSGPWSPADFLPGLRRQRQSQMFYRNGCMLLVAAKIFCGPPLSFPGGCG